MNVNNEYAIIVLGWNFWIIKTSRFAIFINRDCSQDPTVLLKQVSPTTAVKLFAICISAARCQ